MTLHPAAYASSRSAHPSGFAAALGSAWTIPALGVAMIVLDVAALAAQLADALHPNIALTLAQGVVYLGAVAAVLRGAPASLGWIVAVACVLRLLPVFAPPFHSTDIYRYVWDGQVQGAGINPYLHLPNDPALAGLRDVSVWPRINRADYAPTIYPPAAQAIFFLVTRVSATVTAMKLAFVAFDGVTAWAVLRLLDAAGLPRSRLLVWLWSPLVVWEIAGAGHVDAAMTALVMLAVLARGRARDGLAGVALGAAILVKFLPVVILPALWRRWDWRLPACCAATVVLGYGPYLGAGTKVLGFLPRYAGEEGLSDGTGFWIARVAGGLSGTPVPPLLFLGVTACLLGLLALAVVTRLDDAARPVGGALALAAAGMVALSPAYPWYFVWLVPFLCIVPHPALLWLTAGGALLYWDNARMVPWMNDILLGGLCLLAVAVPLFHVFTARSGRMA